MAEFDRRNFLSAVTAGAVALGSRLKASAASRIVGANDRIVLGAIGIGRQGSSDLRAFLKQPDVTVAALCDVYEPNLEAAGKLAPSAIKVRDAREILDNKDIDAVLVASPDHWHPLHTIMACRAGKDVYVEKPVSVTITEGRKMVEAARKYKRVVQVNTQQHSGTHFKKAVDIIHSGVPFYAKRLVKIHKSSVGRASRQSRAWRPNLLLTSCRLRPQTRRRPRCP